VPDLVDDRAQRGNVEMLALRVVEPETGRFDLPDRALDGWRSLFRLPQSSNHPGRLR
jgi:hypothetical protein